MNMYHGVTGTQFRGSSSARLKTKKTSSVLLLADHQARMTRPGQLIHHALIQPDIRGPLQ